MATFNVVLDKRVKRREGKFNLAVRVSHGNDIMYINLQKMTESQYNRVFVKKSIEKEHIAFREKCDQYITKCEKIHGDLKPFNKERFREGVREKDTEKPNSLLLRELFDHFIKE